jgi:hypothetical protein
VITELGAVRIAEREAGQVPEVRAHQPCHRSRPGCWSSVPLLPQTGPGAQGRGHRSRVTLQRNLPAVLSQPARAFHCSAVAELPLDLIRI